MAARRSAESPFLVALAERVATGSWHCQAQAGRQERAFARRRSVGRGNGGRGGGRTRQVAMIFIECMVPRWYTILSYFRDSGKS